MLIQATPLIPDVEYFMDAAVEHTELDGASLVALKLYGDRREITRIVDEVMPAGVGYFGTDGPTRMCVRLAKCDALMAYADDVIARLDTSTRGAICYAGLQHLRYEIDRTANFCATTAYQDAIVGGCLVAYKAIRTRWQRAYLPPPRARRRLYGPGWIRRAAVRERESHALRRMGTRALNRAAGVDLATARAGGDVITRHLRAQHDAYRRTNEAAIQRFSTRLAHTSDKSRQWRNVIKRAAKTAVMIVGHHDVSMFARGGRVVIPGETLSLEVARQGSAAQLGHGGLRIAAVDKVTGEHLADLCVYHEGTPALDQLTALVLGMRAGEEAEILATANLSRVSDAGRAHPLIADRGPSESRWEPHDDVSRANEAYWQETKSLWREAVGTFVLGRMWARLERQRA